MKSPYTSRLLQGSAESCIRHRNFRPHSICQRGFLNVARQQHDPLRILFCGADEFSIYSLRAVHELQKRKPESIASIDVVCRPDKRVGRGLKQIQEVPIKSMAKELQLPLHQIDTFTGWTLPSPVDLVIAVSFGLLVPARILKEARYGGLNVHPSMLPDLRGPAPIQHALLRGRSHTGVTLQTMHPTRFDHGMIIAQTEQPGIPIADGSTPEQLIHQLGPIGADLLQRGIEDGLFVSPKPVIEVTGSESISHAPKITPADRKIDWETWTAEQIIRRDRVLGRLWDTTTYSACYVRDPKRVTFNGPWKAVPREDLHDRDVGVLEGVPTLSHVDGKKKPRLAFHTVDRQLVSPEAATIDGEQKGRAVPGLVQAIKASYKKAKEEGSTDGEQPLGTRIWY